MTSTRTLATTTIDHVGETVTLNGWVDTKRDHGKLTFVDLRDRSGKVQCVAQNMMGELTTESVISVTGLVKKRPDNLINQELPTGTVEIEVKSYEVLNKAEDLPIQVKSDGRDEDENIRLQYRYLDLRRSRMQHNLRLRSKLFTAFREALADHDFTEVETPLLTKSTKEGARDFIVPSRFQPGKFYALPQSPQQYKQLLMTAGVERYFQFARCVRDEDLRADRGFEFTQLDLEMSFVDRDQSMSIIEDMTKKAIKAVGGKLKDEKFPVINYQDAIEKYGADKFDLRTEEEKEQGVLSFAWVVNFPFFKQVDADDAAEVRDGKSGWTFTHNPFSAPLPEYEADMMTKKNIGNIITTQYDLVCNGYEAGGGSIRTHNPELLRTTFEIMGYSPKEIEASVGHMLKAFKLGTPPHGGIAFGIDRLVMLLAGEQSIKETIAFPMTSTGRTAVMDAPATVSQQQLDELSLDVVPSKAYGDQIYPAILKRLRDSEVSYELLAHEPVTTSEEAANVRGTDGSDGAKALILQADDELILYVLPGNQRADLKKLAANLGKDKIKMAAIDTVTQKTGLPVGAVPPFGSVMGLTTYLHPDLASKQQIAFNVGRKDKSIVMSQQDFQVIEQPQII